MFRPCRARKPRGPVPAPTQPKPRALSASNFHCSFCLVNRWKARASRPCQPVHGGGQDTVALPFQTATSFTLSVCLHARTSTRTQAVPSSRQNFIEYATEHPRCGSCRQKSCTALVTATTPPLEWCSALKRDTTDGRACCGQGDGSTASGHLSIPAKCIFTSTVRAAAHCLETTMVQRRPSVWRSAALAASHTRMPRLTALVRY